MNASSKNPQDIGKYGEDLAKKWLESHGFVILFKNVRTEYGEIDLIARKDARLHFVEVKTRRTKLYGNPEDAVTKTKAAHLVDSALRFFQTHPEFEGDWQIDVVAIQIEPKSGDIEIRRFENAL